MLRLFTGLSLPKTVRRRLQLMQGGVPGARWSASENLHLTLTFIGDVDEAAAEDIDEALASVRAEAFSLALRGTGSFAQGSRPKVLWLGVAADPRLFQLKEKIDRALEIRRLPFENRKYTPHVTLGRLKKPDEGKIADFMQAHNLFATGPFEARSFNLYRSHQTGNGVAYEALRSYALA